MRTACDRGRVELDRHRETAAAAPRHGGLDAGDPALQSRPARSAGGSPAAACAANCARSPAAPEHLPGDLLLALRDVLRLGRATTRRGW